MQGDQDLEDTFEGAWDAMASHQRAREGEVVCARDGCGRQAAPGSEVCRQHGAMLPVAQAAAEVRLAAARMRIGDILEGAVVEAVQFYVDVMRGIKGDGKTAAQIQAADRIVALCGGQLALTGATEEGEMSGPMLILQQMLAAAPDDRLERLALRIGAIPATSSADGEQAEIV